MLAAWLEIDYVRASDLPYLQGHLKIFFWKIGRNNNQQCLFTPILLELNETHRSREWLLGFSSSVDVLGYIMKKADKLIQLPLFSIIVRITWNVERRSQALE